MKFYRVLIPTDFSENSAKVFPIVAREAQEGNARICIFHTTTDWTILGYPGPEAIDPSVIAHYREIIEKRANEGLQAIKNRYFSNLEVELIHLFSSESTGTAITRYASENKHDGIFMTTHGRNAVGTLFLGSVVQQVLRSATCPVVVIPAH